MNPTNKLRILANSLGTHEKHGNEFLFFCPFCHHKKRKFSINLEKNVAKCWVCGKRFKNIALLFKFLNQIENYFKWIDDPVFILQEEISKNLGFNERKEEQKIELPKSFVSLYEFFEDPQYKLAIDYLNFRGLTKKEILKWRLGHSYPRKIIIPSFDESGELNYFVAKSYIDGKYSAPKFPKSGIIFNELYIDWRKEIYLVEGVFDMFKVPNSIPLLGNSFSFARCSRLINKLKNCKRDVVVCLDADASKNASRLVAELFKYGVSPSLINLQGGPFKDPGEMNFGDIEKFEKIPMKTREDFLNEMIKEVMK